MNVVSSLTGFFAFWIAILFVWGLVSSISVARIMQFTLRNFQNYRKKDYIVLMTLIGGNLYTISSILVCLFFSSAYIDLFFMINVWYTIILVMITKYCFKTWLKMECGLLVRNQEE